MLLAAGHGKRMLPLTNTTPKPLLKVGQLSLIEHHIVKLENAGFKHLVINIAHLGEQIQQCLGDGTRFGIKITYSSEIDDGPLETAGGILKALPLIKSDSFICINADIFTDYRFTELLDYSLEESVKGHLVLVKNPEHNPDGDFLINDQGLLAKRSNKTGYTYSGIAYYHRSLFQDLIAHKGTRADNKKLALAPLFHEWINKRYLGASLYHGAWTDVGTPERLQQLNLTMD